MYISVLNTLGLFKEFHNIFFENDPSLGKQRKAFFTRLNSAMKKTEDEVYEEEQIDFDLDNTNHFDKLKQKEPDKFDKVNMS